MSGDGHRCGPPYRLKAAGRCLCCHEDAYEVRVVRTEPGHQLDGHPLRIGPMLERGTQVEFLLSDGSEASITFCLDCGVALHPSQYQDVWRACLDRNDVALLLAGRSDNERTLRMADSLAIWPVAVIRRRHEVEGVLAVDRRG